MFELILLPTAAELVLLLHAKDSSGNETDKKTDTMVSRNEGCYGEQTMGRFCEMSQLITDSNLIHLIFCYRASIILFMMSCLLHEIVVPDAW